MRTYTSRVLGALSVFLLLAIAPMRASAIGVIVTVDETNTDWGFFAETGTPTGGYELGPGTPPGGSGSAAFHLTAGADGMGLGTTLYNGVRLDAITALTYSTYQNMTPQAVAFQINIDYDDTDATNSWQGRLVYEPYYTEVVNTGVWQSWDLLAAGGTGNWWGTGTPVAGDVAMGQPCPPFNPCTMAEVLSNFPNARVHTTASGLGAILLKAGSGWPAGFDGYADYLNIVATGVGDFTYDFETTVPVELSQFTIE